MPSKPHAPLNSNDDSAALRVRLKSIEERNEALIRAQRPFLSLASASDKAFWIFSFAANRLEYFSPALPKLLGLPELPKALNSIDWLETVHPEDRSRIIALRDKWRSGKSEDSFSMEYRVKKDGGIAWLRHSVTNIRETDGTVWGASGMIEDISEQRNALDSSKRKGVLLAAVAQADHALLIENDLAISLYRALETLGTAAGATRAHVSEKMIDEGGDVRIVVRHEWPADSPGSRKGKCLCADAPPEQRQMWISSLVSGKPVTITEGECNGESKPGSTGRASPLLLMPIFVGGSFVGTVGFEGCPISPGDPDSEISLFEAAASAIGGAIIRGRAETALRASNDRFKSLFDNAADAIMIHGEGGIVLEANAVACERLGYTRDEMIGKKPFDFISPEQHHLIANRIDRIFSTGALFGESVHIAKDGRRVPIELNCRKIQYDGKAAFISVARDITERKKAHEEFLRSEERVRQLVQNTDDLIMMQDPEGRYLYYNGPAKYGFTSEDLVGKTPYDFHPRELADAYVDETRKVVESGNSSSAERAVHWKGEVLWFLEHRYPIRDAKGHVVAVGTISRNITLRKKAELDRESAHKSTELRRSEISALLAAARSVMECYFFQDAARCIFEGLKEVVGAVSGFVALLSEDRKSLDIVLIESPHPVNRNMPTSLPIKGMRAEAIRSASVIYDNSYENTLPHEHVQIKSALFAPIVLGNTVEGLICLTDKVGGFNENDRASAKAFCEIASLALQNSRIIASLRESEQRLELALHGADLSLWDWNIPSDSITYDQRFVNILGYKPEEINGVTDLSLPMMHPDDLIVVKERMQEHLDGLAPHFDHVVRWRTKAGEYRVISTQGRIVERDQDGKPLRVIGTHLDITDSVKAEEEKSKLQEQLLQAMKMESIGRLAGGVAHDFNNLLSPIIGYSDLGLLKYQNDEQLAHYFGQIRFAADKASSLTSQLLAFGRKQILAMRRINLNRTIEEFSAILKRLIGEDVELIFNLSPDVGTVKADPDQVQNIVMNLAVNARDAMSARGKITIETMPVRLDREYCKKKPELRPGDYCVLAVSDTGSGMTEDLISHIFEPFYTTKERGKGTGLGLATVYGIVKQHGGHITVDSAIDKGTTFRIYLPSLGDAPEDEQKRESPASEVAQGSGTILVVEDEEMVRTMVCEALEEGGYNVLCADTPEQALEIAGKRVGRIDLLLTDVVMPRMNGKELYAKLSATAPDTRVLYMSGYTYNVVAQHGILEQEIAFLPKPFTIEALAKAVSEALA